MKNMKNKVNKLRELNAELLALNTDVDIGGFFVDYIIQAEGRWFWNDSGMKQWKVLDYETWEVYSIGLRTTSGMLEVSEEMENQGMWKAPTWSSVSIQSLKWPYSLKNAFL